MKINFASMTDVLHGINLKKPSIFLNAEVYTPANKFVQKNLYFNNGKILSRDKFEKIVSSDVVSIDLRGKYITPNLLDQHIHGGYGIDFNNADEEQIRNFLAETKKYGYGGILATLVPDSIEKLNKQIKTITNVINKPLHNETKILGINLEGPFFNPAKAGIHPPQILLKPTVENLSRLNLTDVKMLTIAPELDDGYKACEYLNSKGIITSAGHSIASAKQVRESKVKQVTHLFNAMSGFHHRIPTIANEGLLNDNIYAEVNSAKELLDPETVRLILKAKPPDKIILISDALSGTNIKEDHFFMGGKRIDIDANGIAKDKDGILAGSIKLLGQVARQLVETTKMGFADFIRFASINPAKNLKAEHDFKIRTGMDANLTIWDKKTLLPEKTFIKGE